MTRRYGSAEAMEEAGSRCVCVSVCVCVCVCVYVQGWAEMVKRVNMTRRKHVPKRRCGNSSTGVQVKTSQVSVSNNTGAGRSPPG